MLARVHEEMLEGIKHLDESVQGKIVLAYVNYQLYGIEPSHDDILVYSVFMAKKFELDSIKKDVIASVNNGKKGGRTKKTFKNLKQPKGILKEPNGILKEPEEKQEQKVEEKTELTTVELMEKPKENSESSVLYNNIYINKNNITRDINILIQELKEESNNLGIVYEKKNERNFAKHILTANDFGEFANKIKQTRTEFAKNIMKASVLIGYWKGPCSGPMSIYQNYAEVYNKTMQQSIKKQKNEIQSF